jgi:hypothetical protein
MPSHPSSVELPSLLWPAKAASRRISFVERSKMPNSNAPERVRGSHLHGTRAAEIRRWRCAAEHDPELRSVPHMHRRKTQARKRTQKTSATSINLAHKHRFQHKCEPSDTKHTDEPSVAKIRGHALLPEAEVTAVRHHVGVVTVDHLKWTPYQTVEHGHEASVADVAGMKPSACSSRLKSKIDKTHLLAGLEAALHARQAADFERLEHRRLYFQRNAPAHEQCIFLFLLETPPCCRSSLGIW